MSKVRPICKCGNLCKTNGFSKKDGRQLYNTYCRQCSKKKHNKKGMGFNKRMKGGICESCGFIAIKPCQLDLDHIDGNKLNNSTNNIQTLCANCHRLKTFISKDWITP